MAWIVPFSAATAIDPRATLSGASVRHLSVAGSYSNAAFCAPTCTCARKPPMT
jgi:hypothetical protein